MIRPWILLLALLLGAITPARAADGGSALVQEALAESRAAVGRELPDLAFRDEEGRPFTLGGLRGRPWLLVPVYSACSSVCPTVVQNLLPIVENARELLGRDRFSVVVLGFDSAHDDPARMRAFARAQGADLPGWHFLSGDAKSVERLLEVIGFSFVPSAGGFQHLAQVSLIGPDGRILRQIHGDVFAPPQIVEPLKDAVLGRGQPVRDLGDVVDRIRLWCTVYDPASGRYEFDYSLFIGIAIGIAALSTVGIVLAREWRRARERAHMVVSTGEHR